MMFLYKIAQALHRLLFLIFRNAESKKKLLAWSPCDAVVIHAANFNFCVLAHMNFSIFLIPSNTFGILAFPSKLSRSLR